MDQGNGIFVLDGTRQLTELHELPYDRETEFQELLALHPELLPGYQISPDNPRRWLLIRREAAIGDSEESSGRWSVDHFFLDQDAVPTIVEVKRSQDTRLRREVVGQMLDYAANAIAYWPIDHFRMEFEQQFNESARTPMEALADFLQVDSDESEAAEEAFWQQAKTNLQAGKIRMLFVADVIPTELERVVEFLNAQMDPAEVLAIEIKRYGNRESLLSTHVPRVIGRTAEAAIKKSAGRSSTPKSSWNAESFRENILAIDKTTPEEKQAIRDLFDAVENHAVDLRYGTGKEASAMAYLNVDPSVKALSLYANGHLTIHFVDYEEHEVTQLTQDWRRFVTEDCSLSWEEKEFHRRPFLSPAQWAPNLQKLKALIQSWSN